MSMEYAAGGSLSSFIKKRLLIRDFTRMILQGLVSIHGNGYVHCDLKPDNLLVFPRYEEAAVGGGGVMKEVSYELKLSDFGMSTEAGEESVFWEFDSPYLGTPLYMSPESVNYGVAEKSLDLWSLGCVVLEMYTGESPWALQDSDEILRHLLDGKSPEIPDSLPWHARQFLQTCFTRNPVERGSASGLLKHPFLLSDQKKVMVTGAGNRRKSVMKKPLRVKIIPPKPPQFKKIANKPLRLKIIPPKPPGCSLVSVQ
ncbi:Protein kinase superfamily protein [Raphanus sativus]|uniref:Mitogen-activated protein kinase kinase kinase 20-like n=1 Tax=Raphanus sativus TaxID=3726 RepID=A0A6J0JR97_RAPSA|nr:mitogen-activated protein kinase kinase kinase 20-like [Raphanus sativus]KAJ4891407.1 Protein kinase superfamily protein [Raphanus sativus]